ncbi:protein mab-21-like 3 [Latimeria chalumnae]|uniref:Mab-21 like 3 n=1 Tax=Latimeria chalumnae TaxID=7897 RepID=H3A8U0_LATCH|nr:PREDICTED: protein mab-21-like 3 [Latimeria chalumnae]|eukprot:XP_006001986.1 PREDICTED: protein mab-21-like 3 [Latimeria chalumnae]
MKEFTEEHLDHFLQNQVDLRHRRVSKMVEEVQQLIHELTTSISFKDSRFQSISNAGIHNENIKDQPALLAKWSALLRGKRPYHPAIQVLSAAQFLIFIPLRGLANYKERKARQWRYYTLSGTWLLSPVQEPEKLHQWLEVEHFAKSSQEWHKADVTIEGDIIPAKVVSVFRQLVETAIKSCTFSGKVSMVETIGPVVRVAVETSELQVEVELIPTVEVPNCWSKKARWPRLLKRWPSKEKARCIKSFGYNLMARSNYHWQLSFSRAEHVLMDGIDEDGGCRMKCFRVIRQLKEDVWCSGSKPVITSYHLQTLLLWSCEKHPRAKDWQDFKASFLRLVKKLHKCVCQHFLKHYFVRGYNLLKYANTNELDLVAQKVVDFLANPRLYMH